MSADDWDTKYQYDGKLMKIFTEFAKLKPRGMGLLSMK
jgi:hypothetical protein